MRRNVWKRCPYCSVTYFSRSSDGFAASAVPTSEATRTASRRGDRAGIEPAMRSVVQRKSAASAVSISARNAIRPNAIRQYRLRYQRGPPFSGDAPRGLAGSDIGCFVSSTPDGQNRFGIARRPLDLLPQTLDQCIDAANRHERLVLPDAAEKRLPTEHDTRIRQQHVQQFELVEREIDVDAVDTDAPPGRINFDVVIGDRRQG